MTATWPEEYTAVFSRLSKVVPRQGWWEACCPVHGDKRQSLSLKIGRDRRLLVHCNASCHCEVKDIMSAIGLPVGALFPDGGASARSGEKLKFSCAYAYKDEAGKLLFQVVRWLKEDGDKTFSQRCPNPCYDKRFPRDRDKNPEWINGVKGVRLVLYRLQELQAALKTVPDRAVFVVEGEKSADYCRSIGLCATTGPMGAGKWQASYSELLAGCNVVVVPDADEVGTTHAARVCLSLYGLAASVRLLSLPDCQPKWGLDDWTAAQIAGGDLAKTLFELGRLVKACPLWQPDISGLAESGLLAAELARLSPGDDAMALHHLLGFLECRSKFATAELIQAAESGLSEPRRRRLKTLLLKLSAAALIGLRSMG